MDFIWEILWKSYGILFLWYLLIWDILNFGFTTGISSSNEKSYGIYIYIYYKDLMGLWNLNGNIMG